MTFFVLAYVAALACVLVLLIDLVRVIVLVRVLVIIDVIVPVLCSYYCVLLLLRRVTLLCVFVVCLIVFLFV